MGTPFVDVYNRFLGKITDDMYVELTPQDTIRDLRNLIIDAIPNFEFPRKNLDDYTLETEIKGENEVLTTDFIIGMLWQEDDAQPDEPPRVVIEHSYFAADLTAEEINIIAQLMLISWVQRQVTSIENTRMKFTGQDFKMTSQANHLSKLVSLLNESRTQSTHLQRLYKRRKPTGDGGYKSNWYILRKSRAEEET